MSGPENLRGFDYQITYSLLKVLELFSDYSPELSMKFESIGEDEEDFNVYGDGWQDFHQVKKRSEGNHWTPGGLKPIFKKFVDKDRGSTNFYFITDGSANPDVKKLKAAIKADDDFDGDFLVQFLPEGVTKKRLSEILKRTILYTRYFSSDDDEDPSKILKKEVLETINRYPFALGHTVEICYSRLWKIIFDYAREAKTITIQQIKEDFLQAGVSFVKNPWSDFPAIEEFQGRKVELHDIETSLSLSNKIIIYGINGIGKTLVSSKIIHETALNSTCWIKCDRWTSIDYFMFLITSLLYSQEHEYEAKSLQGLEIADRVPALLGVLERVAITIVVDSINSGSQDLNLFIENLLEESLCKKIKANLIISSTKRIQGYSESDVTNNRISEYYLTGFTLDDSKLIMSSINSYLGETEIAEFHNAVGGHPMAIFFLKELIGKKSITTDDLHSISSKSVETARDWIIERSIMQLSAQDCQGAVKVCH